MNRTVVDPIANAILYEGYLLYPYRPSVKNRQRWTFGGLYPEAFGRAQGDASASQTECLVCGGSDTTVEVIARFLHLTDRTVGELDRPLAEWPEATEPSFRSVETLRVGDTVLQVWQEAEEREVYCGRTRLADLLERPLPARFAFPSRRWLEPVRKANTIMGVLVREQHGIEGTLELRAAPVAERLFKLTLCIANRTPWEDGTHDRDHALQRALVSTHALLGVEGGDFVSLVDPPDAWRDAAAGCRSVGAWPVLVGAEGQMDTLLSAPIILCDYPQVAPESPGDLFDGTEIDEILTLRILTLTEEEKQQMAGMDERVRALLVRSERMGREQLLGLHGTMRRLRVPGGGSP
ncbi:MAG: hypothetical protein K2R98_11265 [Gemmataceae bacterium]|nr:hypothetical protein [Gemmataceae bacterium]